jgi:HK97 family phage major capsid protein
MADITKADALALLATQEINTIIKPETSSSAALSAFRTVRMSAGTVRQPVLEALPTAGWVTESATADSGRKPTSKVSWGKKELIAEEMAVIIPIHENTLADSNFDIWGEIRPLVAQEFGRILDAAVFFGVNKPLSWRDPSLVEGSILAGNYQVLGAGDPEPGGRKDLAADFNEAFALVEDNEFDVNSAFTGRFLRRSLRGLRDDDGNPIYLDALRTDGSTASIYGQNLNYLTNGGWDREAAVALVGDSSKVVLGIREDVQVKLLDQATIGTGVNQINLAERDMVALRFKFRVAYATQFSTARVGGSPEDYPFAVIVDSDPTVGDGIDEAA